MPATEWRGLEKVAALLLSLEESIAGKVLEHLDEITITEIGSALAEIDPRDLEGEELAALHMEFATTVERLCERPDLSPEGLSSLLRRTLGEERAGALVRDITARARAQRPFRPLLELDVDLLTAILRDEHPQVIAVVCSYLPPEITAVVLRSLDEDVRYDMVRRLANLDVVSPALCEQLCDGLLVKAEERAALPLDHDDDHRLRTLAEILNATDRDIERALMKRIREEDETTADAIRHRMFAFDDLARLGRREMEKLLGHLEIRHVAMALKACSPEVERNFLGCMSKRAGFMVKEEREDLGPVPLREVLRVQDEILDIVRDLLESGELAKEGRDELVT
ncbi:MAG: hypothetical protein H6834_05045 [Planctomycetes bacterium]|nr:hypothetical protein [Planctomycetota bacterium]